MEQRHSMVARSEMAATSVDEFVPEVAPNRRFRILNQLIASSPLDHHKVYIVRVSFSEIKMAEKQMCMII